MNTKPLSKQQQTVIRETFGDLPIEDARGNLLVIPSQSDVAGAKQGDPANCAMSRTCKRMYGSTAVVFFRSRAYVDLPSEDGKRVIKRFIHPANLQDAIVEFDKTGKFPLNGFVLYSPPRTKTLKYRAQQAREYAKKITKGHKPRPTAGDRKAKYTKKAWALLGIRSGHGQAPRRRATA